MHRARLPTLELSLHREADDGAGPARRHPSSRRSSAAVLAELEGQIRAQASRVAAVTEALINLPNSKSLSASLATEEKKLGDLEGQRDAAARDRPRVLPHPAAVAKHVADLADIIESGDPTKVGPVLRRVLAPFRMTPAGNSYILRGALDLTGPLRVCDENSSGGTLLDYSETGWIPIEFMTSARSAVCGAFFPTNGARSR